MKLVLAKSDLVAIKVPVHREGKIIYQIRHVKVGSEEHKQALKHQAKSKGSVIANPNKQEGTKGKTKEEVKVKNGELKPEHKGKKLRVAETAKNIWRGIVGTFTGEFNAEGHPKLKVHHKGEDVTIAVPPFQLAFAKSRRVIIPNYDNTYSIYKSYDLIEIAVLQGYADFYNQSLLKSKNKGKLVPVQKLVSRGGKNFSITYWVSPQEAKQLKDRKDIIVNDNEFGEGKAREIKYIDSYTKEDYTKMTESVDDFSNFFKDNQGLFSNVAKRAVVGLDKYTDRNEALKDAEQVAKLAVTKLFIKPVKIKESENETFGVTLRKYLISVMVNSLKNWKNRELKTMGKDKGQVPIAINSAKYEKRLMSNLNEEDNKFMNTIFTENIEKGKYIRKDKLTKEEKKRVLEIFDKVDYLKQANITSIDAMGSKDGEKDISFEEFIANNEESTEDKVNRDMILDNVRRELRDDPRFTKESRLINLKILNWIVDGFKQREIANKLGKKESEVSKRIKQYIKPYVEKYSVEKSMSYSLVKWLKSEFKITLEEPMYKTAIDMGEFIIDFIPSYKGNGQWTFNMIKAKKASIGEVREWKGKKFKKVSNGKWQEITEGKKGEGQDKKEKDNKPENDKKVRQEKVKNVVKKIIGFIGEIFTKQDQGISTATKEVENIGDKKMKEENNKPKEEKPKTNKENPKDEKQKEKK